MTDYYEPELGELVFGAAWSAYGLEDEWVDEELREITGLVIQSEWDDMFAKILTLEQALWGTGSGVEVKNSIFEMRMYYWGDCICGYEDLENEWLEANSHDSECLAGENWREKCDCGYIEKWHDWSMGNFHDPECPLVKPNFKHFDSGVEIRWYKYIGRGMSVNEDGITRDEWRKIFQECRDSLK